VSDPYTLELTEAGVFPELHELSDAELIWARTHWQHWGGAYGKFPTEQEWEEEFEARRAAREYERDLAEWHRRLEAKESVHGFKLRWLPPDWPHERGRNGARLPFG
jgi:hypothetical protein